MYQDVLVLYVPFSLLMSVGDCVKFRKLLEEDDSIPCQIRNVRMYYLLTLGVIRVDE